MLDPIEFSQALIRRASVTPADAGCQALLIEQLQRLGFSIEKLPFGNVENFWARRGTGGPLLAFAGHTDVVPSGPTEQWASPPFRPEIRDGKLYGRGAADMKGNIAAMLAACERFITEQPQHKGSIAWLITGDEEGDAVNGTVKVIKHLTSRGEKIDLCIVGEPSSENVLGDTIKIGRRGSLSGHLTIHGKQGHIAYPQLADNPIHKVIPALAILTKQVWDKGDAYFPPTSLQISNIHAGTGVNNVIPGELSLDFNFRYAPAVSAEALQKEVEALLKAHSLQYTLQWRHSGLPFLTEQGELIKAASQAVKKICGIEPTLATGGGTSDGRFIAPTGAQVIELGLCNNTIHQIDEYATVADIEQLSSIYQAILEQLL